MDDARALTENLATLLRREHLALGEFLVALADFDRRRAWEQLGYSSLFYFLHRELRLSKAGAQYRKVAAELIQAVPAAIEPLRQGKLCLNSVIEAAQVVTAENWTTVLPRFYGLSRREAAEVVAELQPHPAPPVRTVVTAAPAPVARQVAAAPADLPLAPEPGLAPEDGPSGSSHELTPGACPAAAGPAPRPVEVVPLTAQDRRLHVTVSKQFLEKLAAATDALSHSHPGAAAEEILEAGLDLLLEKAAKRRGAAKRPLKVPRPSMKSNHIPAHVRRAVWARDGGRCQFPLASGGVCGSTYQVELDHIEPLARGGESTVEGLRCACKPHNLRAARLVLGDELMDRYAPRRKPGVRPRADETRAARPGGTSPP